jgi:mRNA interferase YafQ
MKKIHYSTKSKKDLKKYRHNPKKMKGLFKVLDMLIEGVEIPESYEPHKLIGQYKGCMECHIEGDFLLIWLDINSDIIEIIRIGTHSELFK